MTRALFYCSRCILVLVVTIQTIVMTVIQYIHYLFTEFKASKNVTLINCVSNNYRAHCSGLSPLSLHL